MSRTYSCHVAREIAPITRGGIGEAIRNRVLERGDADSPLLLLDLPPRLVRNLRARLPDDVVLRSVEESCRPGLPMHVFCSEAYWRSYRIWLALDRLRTEFDLSSVEFPDYEGLGFVPIKAARLGVDPHAPPYVVRIHGTAEWAARADGRSISGLAERQMGRMERYALQYADRVIAPSKAILDAYRRDYPLASEVRIEAPIARVPDGIRREAAVGRPPDETLSIGYLGKLQPLKGPSVLVKAAVAILRTDPHKKIEVHLVGSDEHGSWGPSHLDELKTLIPEDVIRNFTFHGALPKETALSILARCDAAVVPSRMETFGLAAHELALLGLPLALSDIEAFRAAFDGTRSIEFFPVDDDARLREILEAWHADLEHGTWPPAERKDSLPRKAAKRMPSVPARPDTAKTGIASRVPASSGTESPRVTIVIPFFEMHDFIDECLDSIRDDGFESKEIIIVDDGSRSPEARQKLSDLERRSDPRAALRVLPKPNGGLGSARNLGAHHARGEYVLFLDPDDRIAPGYLRAATLALDRCPELFFVTCISRLFPDGSSPEAGRDWIVPYDPDLAMLYYENGAGCSAGVFRRTLFDDFRFREDLPAYEDWAFQLALASAGKRGECLPVEFHHYRQRPEGLSRLAHRNHDQLVGRILAPYLDSADPALADALGLFVAANARLRGLGTTRRWRGGPARRLEAWAEAVYRRRLKAWLHRTLGDESRERIVRLGRWVFRGKR